MHDVKYLRGVHEELHKDINHIWEDFASLYPNLTPNQVELQALEIDQDFRDAFVFP